MATLTPPLPPCGSSNSKPGCGYQAQITGFKTSVEGEGFFALADGKVTLTEKGRARFVNDGGEHRGVIRPRAPFSIGGESGGHGATRPTASARERMREETRAEFAATGWNNL